MAGAPKKPEPKLIRMNVSKGLYSYLGTLARSTVLGASENDVAATLLTNALKEMREANYHEAFKVPVEEPKDD